MAAFDEPDYSKRKYPVFWEMTRRCMSGGEFVHFPRGTYQDQMNSDLGSIEVSSMETLFHVRRIIHRRKSGWKGSQEKTKQDVEFFESLGWERKQIFSEDGLRNHGSC